MKILIDVLGYLTESRKRGIGRYTRDFVYSLIGSGHDVHLLVNVLHAKHAKSVLREFKCVLPEDSLHTWMHLPILEPFSTSSRSLTFSSELLTSIIKKVGPDVVVFSEPMTQGVTLAKSSDIGAKAFAIVYDLIPAVYPDEYLGSVEQKSWFEFRLRQLSQLDGILTISESSKSEIQRFLPNMLIENIGCDTSSGLHTLAGDSGSTGIVSSLRDQRFLLYVGGYDPRKMIPFLVRSMARLQAESQHNGDVRLVLAGPMHDSQRAELNAIVKGGKLEGVVLFAGYVDDPELSWLYKNCLLYVNPSKHEGFGLPVLEAMRCGTPLLVANNTNAAELVTIDAAKFETGNMDDFLFKVKSLLDNVSLREQVINYGQRKQKEYSWKKTGALALKVLQRNIEPSKQKKKIASASADPLQELYSKMRSYKLTSEETVLLAKAINRTIKPEQSQVLMDVTILVSIDSGSGIQRVSRSIFNAVQHALAPERDVYPVYFCSAGNSFKYARYDQSLNRFIKSKHDEAADFNIDDHFIGLDLNHSLPVNYPDAFTKLVESDATVSFIVYDLLPLKYPEYFDVKHDLTRLHDAWIEGVCMADNLICISRSVMDDLQERIARLKLGHKYLNVDWFHLGSDIENSLPSLGYPEDFQESIAEVRKRTSILMVGTLEPRKGYEEVLGVTVKLLADLDINLVIVGKPGWKSDEVVQRLEAYHDTPPRLFWFSSISDQALEEVYDACDGLIAASYDEGFGLPIIEAASHGLPIFARDIPVFREVAKSGATFFSTDLHSELIDWVESLKNNTAVSATDIVRLSWEQSADMLLSRCGIDRKC